MMSRIEHNIRVHSNSVRMRMKKDDLENGDFNKQKKYVKREDMVKCEVVGNNQRNSWELLKNLKQGGEDDADQN